jgi:hypothetical protein
VGCIVRGATCPPLSARASCSFAAPAAAVDALCNCHYNIHTSAAGASTPAGASMAAAEAKRLRDALSRVGVMGSEVPKATFATKHLEQDLGRLLTVRGRGGQAGVGRIEGGDVEVLCLWVRQCLVACSPCSSCS